MKTRTQLIIIALITFFLKSCNQDDSCAIVPLQNIDPTTLNCVMYEDFESYEPVEARNRVQNWIASEGDVGIDVDASGNTVLRGFDQQSPHPNWRSHIYNLQDFPTDFISAGCILQYQFKYDAHNIANADSTRTSIVLFQGPNLNSNTEYARFFLHKRVASEDPSWATVDIPLYLANPNFPTVFPNNSSGYWTMATGKTATDFNNLIQNVDGIALLLDSGSHPSELWWYDNFCFKQCD